MSPYKTVFSSCWVSSIVCENIVAGPSAAKRKYFVMARHRGKARRCRPSRCSLLALFELERDAVQAVAQSGGRGSVVKNMAEMGAAARTKNLVAFHPEAIVFYRRDDSRNERLG